VADSVLTKRIRTIHMTSHETYGVPRVHAELRAGGQKHGRKRIARLMRAAGIVGVSRRRGTVVTTRRDKDARRAPDLVDRDFSAAAPNQLWVADITFIPTAAGFLYLAVVLDTAREIGRQNLTKTKPARSLSATMTSGGWTAFCGRSHSNIKFGSSPVSKT
jgi:transposase InsO family protein